jgi:hypothetical protein
MTESKKLKSGPWRKQARSRSRSSAPWFQLPEAGDLPEQPGFDLQEWTGAVWIYQV